MTTAISIHDFFSKLINGLKERKIEFVVAQDSLGCELDEVYISDANELVIFPKRMLDQITIQWLLTIRTPLKVRLTIFTSDVTEIKLRVVRAVTQLKQDGIEIPNIKHAISIQKLTDLNLQRLLDSLENWHMIKTNGRPFPLSQHEQSKHYSGLTKDNPLTLDKYQDLHIHLRNVIKTYWTKYYLAKYLNCSPLNIKDLVKRIGIQFELCGGETIYFFNRTKALKTYFSHILKGILNGLNLQYQETASSDFRVPNLRLAIFFFDGEKEDLRILAEEYVKTLNLIVVVPEKLRIKIGKIQDDLFQVIALDKSKIQSVLEQLVR